MKAELIHEWLDAGSAGKAVWLPEVREASEADSAAVQIILRLYNGETIERRISVLRWHNAEEKAFVREYLCDVVFNLLSAFGGSRLDFYMPSNETELCALIGELEAAFSLEGGSHCGFGKCVKVSNRVNASMGRQALSFNVLKTEEYRWEATNNSAVDIGLINSLRMACVEAEQGIYCGIDIGGTDIKLVGSIDGRLACVREYDWNPAEASCAEELIEPIDALIGDFCALAGAEKLDGIGISFPDVVIDDRIVGGETPKTKGMRENQNINYEREFAKLTELKSHLAERFCRTGQIGILNDGAMTAFTTAAELAHSEHAEELKNGVFSISLGTDLGSGWMMGDGSIPQIPLELYDFQLDLGSRLQRKIRPEDIRSVLNENSGLPGVRRYLGQAAAYRLAQELKPELISDFVTAADPIQIRSEPDDMRKPCLEELMRKAEEREEEATEIFRRIGENLGELGREACFVLGELPEEWYVFGRFVKHPYCFKLLSEGFGRVLPQLRLRAADENMAFTPLMRQLSQRKDVTVAQFAQAVGAIYYIKGKNKTVRERTGEAENEEK